MSGTENGNLVIWKKNLQSKEFEQYFMIEKHDSKVVSSWFSEEDDKNYVITVGEDGFINYYSLDEGPRFEFVQETEVLELKNSTDGEIIIQNKSKILDIDMLEDDSTFVVGCGTKENTKNPLDYEVKFTPKKKILKNLHY